MTKRQQHFSSEFRGDLKRARSHRKCEFAALVDIMDRLSTGRALERRHKDHALQGRYPARSGFVDCRECHVCNDWLLVYRYPDPGSLHLIRTGTHSDLF